MAADIEITEAMINAAMESGKRYGALVANARHADVKRLLALAIAAMPAAAMGARFDLIVSTGIGPKKARFVSASTQRGYLYVECEDGQRLHVHANEIGPLGRPR